MTVSIECQRKRGPAEMARKENAARWASVGALADEEICPDISRRCTGQDMRMMIKTNICVKEKDANEM